ncbi:MAG: hypothetical protein A3J83_00800 [Elusimicrobia bacterium RIFOXYA2_FULL_40_6]|nr:MAG: hypothetical protein A3J83_00800 [Elusimicrobia bacterium RIFOXYA2_FULL_40_6]
MILLFNSDLTGMPWKKMEESPAGNEAPEAIGYFLHHGGEKITQTVSILSPKDISKLPETIKYLPEHNDLTIKTIKSCILKYPQSKHVLFCDTAFFSDMPLKAATYAIPYKLRKKGIKKFGGYGLCHQWAYEKAQKLSRKKLEKVLSVYLGNYTNIAAIKNGEPLETSVGFTSVEGIPSSTSCGDIDPTILFQLNSAGMSFKEVNQLLSEKSGLTGLAAWPAGKKCSYLDVIGDKKLSDIKDFFIYNIMKYIGAFISVNGGVDAVIFESEHIKESKGIINELCGRLEFLGVKKRDVFRFEYIRWNVMLEKIKNLI